MSQAGLRSYDYMDEDAGRFDKVNKLITWQAHPEVVTSHAIDLEKNFTAEGTTLFKEGKYDQAITKYLWGALLHDLISERKELLDWALKREESHEWASKRQVLFELALYAYGHLLQTNRNIKDVAALNSSTFEKLKKELEDGWAKKEVELINRQFVKLDREQFLIEKDFIEIEKVLKKLPLTVEGRLIAELRLLREKEAKRLLEEMIGLFRDIAIENDPAIREQKISETQKIKEQAIHFASGASSKYFEQITNYVDEAEKLLLKSKAEQTIEELKQGATKQREEEFAKFSKAVSNNSDGGKTLEVICDALSDFDEHHQYKEIKKISINWIEDHARRYFRRLTNDALKNKAPKKAHETIMSSVKVINDFRSKLSDEAAQEFKPFDDFKQFLEKLAADIEPMIPSVDEQVHTVFQPEPSDGFFTWIKKIFKRGDLK